MITVRETYNDRKKEIEDFLELMTFLESKESDRENGISKFTEFFYSEEGGIHLTYQELINILKSNVSLMLYNIIEYTVANLVDSIYDEIRLNSLSYVDVNESIKTLWRKTILKSANDPNASFNTFIRKNEEIITAILDRRALSMDSRDTLPSGNLDGNSIKETFKLHGVQVNIESPNFRPDIFKQIKNNRNELAHGSVSFVEAMREAGIQDIKDNEKFVVDFLDELIETVATYISEKKYKASLA